ncbi:hypothetical protein CI15_29485 [Paraburkholderia monticola]|uniref:DUF2029 domain-containing protein n=1 Tax=Paraburkholderia monticola TaxID=1399968 RepID=A0A149PDY5_9BURK|nr:glycosyltransferase family 87 protein [Paraburkholderia monticola]KXU83240.1 hypothetical protein CI15_29485 [Paraburkholderia monticola]
MSLTTDKASDGAPQREKRWVTRERVVVYCAALLALQLILLGIWALRWALHVRGAPPLGLDFRVYWSASYVSLHDSAIEVFNPNKLFAAETSLSSSAPYSPWVYPPTFQLLIYPLAWLPYPLSYAGFLCVSIACYSFVCARTLQSKALPLISVIAFPGVWVAAVAGQNSLLTLSLAAGALGLLERRPLLAGVCAGLLAIKPQLAILFPLMFLCGRHFRALGMMVVTGALFCGVSLLVLGVPLWLKFFETLPHFNTVAVENGGMDLWRGMPTVFALARTLGASLPFAYVAHFAVAVPAVLITAMLWARRASIEVRSSAFVVTALLAQPYLMYYDLAWLILPIFYLCRDHERPVVWTSFEGLIISLVWLLPFLAFLTVLTWSRPWSTALLPILLVVVLRRAATDKSRCPTNLKPSEFSY